MTPAPRATQAPPNKLCLWRDSVLYLGDSFDPLIHHHHAVQCCIALRGKLRVRLAADAEWQSCYSVVMGAGVRHSIANPDGPLCILYLEKTSSDSQSIMDWHATGAGDDQAGAHLDPVRSDTSGSRELTRDLLGAMSAPLSAATANALRESFLHLLRGHLSRPQKLDPRVSTLLAKLHEGPGQPISGAELARSVNLSESRMQHVFKAQIGIPIRRYILWMRLRHVLELALLGASLTSAAHAAGFSDLAHFTRTFRSTFGIKPSALLAGEAGLVPLLCERS